METKLKEHHHSVSKSIKKSAKTDLWYLCGWNYKEMLIACVCWSELGESKCSPPVWFKRKLQMIRDNYQILICYQILRNC